MTLDVIHHVGLKMMRKPNGSFSRRVDNNAQAAAADLSTASASSFPLSREVRNTRHYQAVCVTLHWFLLSLRKRSAKMRLADSNSGSKSNGQWTYIYIYIYIYIRRPITYHVLIFTYLYMFMFYLFRIIFSLIYLFMIHVYLFIYVCWFVFIYLCINLESWGLWACAFFDIARWWVSSSKCQLTHASKPKPSYWRDVHQMYS